MFKYEKKWELFCTLYPPRRTHENLFHTFITQIFSKFLSACQGKYIFEFPLGPFMTLGSFRFALANNFRGEDLRWFCTDIYCMSVCPYRSRPRHLYVPRRNLVIGEQCTVVFVLIVTEPASECVCEVEMKTFFLWIGCMGVSKNPSFHTDFKNVHMTFVNSAPKKVLAKKVLKKSVLLA
jgi:hypothetical protein